jgi:hypothetical protein
VVGTRQIKIGQQVQRGLSGSLAVSGRLALTDSTLRSAQQSMDRGASYAAVVIPPGFTASLLNRVGVSASGPGLRRLAIVILTSQRAGTVGVSLASGVMQPGLQAASRQIGRQLAALVPAARASSPLARDFLVAPVTVTTAGYRPLPAHSALGLSAFYIALPILMCGLGYNRMDPELLLRGRLGAAAQVEERRRPATGRRERRQASRAGCRDPATGLRGRSSANRAGRPGLRMRQVITQPA